MARTASPVLRTWTAGEIPLGQYYNSLRDALAFTLAPPQVQCIQTVTQSITNNTATAVLFDTEIVDSDNFHSTATNTTRLVAPMPGWYELKGGVGYAAAAATGYRAAGWQTTISSVTSILAGSFNLAAVSTTVCAVEARTMRVFLNAGDYVELMALHTLGSALGTAATAAWNPTATMTFVSQ
jgi:hypothetical protein